MTKSTPKNIIETLKNNRELLLKFRVKRIGLFGSFSNEQSNANSDIDFLVDFDEKTFDNFMNLSFALEELFKRKIDLVTNKSISPYILPLIEKEIYWYEAN